MRRAALASAARRPERRRGGTLLEFALVAPVLLLLFLAILELAILF